MLLKGFLLFLCVCCCFDLSGALKWAGLRFLKCANCFRLRMTLKSLPDYRNRQKGNFAAERIFTSKLGLELFIKLGTKSPLSGGWGSYSGASLAVQHPQSHVIAKAMPEAIFKCTHCGKLTQIHHFLNCWGWPRAKPSP